MRPIVLSRVPLLEQILFGFLLFSVLWRGGKGLESVWLLVAVAAVLTLSDVMRGQAEMEHGEQGTQYPPCLPVVLASGLFAWTIASFCFSSTANYGLDEVLRDGALVLIFLWTMRRAMRSDAEKFLQRFAMTVTTATVLAAAFGVLVYAMQPVNRFVGTFFDYRFHTDYWPNAWAQYLLLAWPMMLLWMKGKTGRTLFAGYGILGFALGALLLSYSRGAMIALGGQILLLGAWYLLQKKHDREDRWQMADGRFFMDGVAIAFIAFGLFFSINALRGQYHPVQSVAEKITFTADEGGSSVSERAQFWRQSVELMKQKPFYGWGPYSFRFIHQRLQTGVLQTSDHPHNLFLKLAVERGVLASLLFLAFLLCILIPSGKSLAASATLSPQLLLLLSVLGVLAHNLIDYNLQFAGIALPFWMLLGFLAGQHTKHTAAKPLRLNKKFVHISGFIAAIILVIVSFYEGLYLVTSSFGRHAEARGDAAGALWWYDRSNGDYFSRDMHLSRALLATARGETDRAQEAITTYVRLNAEDPRGWRLQGDIARTRGDTDAAADAYRHAYVIGRWNDLSITLALVEIFAATRHQDLEALKPEIDILLDAFTDAVTRDAHFIALSHNAEDAIALADLLAVAFPKEAPRYEVLAAKTDYAMRMERAKVKSRPAGYLW